MDAQADLWAALAALGVMQRKPNGDVRLWPAADGLYQFAVQIHPIPLGGTVPACSFSALLLR